VGVRIYHDIRNNPLLFETLQGLSKVAFSDAEQGLSRNIRDEADHSCNLIPGDVSMWPEDISCRSAGALLILFLQLHRIKSWPSNCLGLAMQQFSTRKPTSTSGSLYPSRACFDIEQHLLSRHLPLPPVPRVRGSGRGQERGNSVMNYENINSHADRHGGPSVLPCQRL
jgi:hypothetical protein